MPWLNLCPGDPLVDTLTEVFGANIVRVPEARIQPLTVAAVRDSQSSFRGALAPLLHGPADALAAVAIGQSRMADLSGRRSRRVAVDLGLDILDGFLRGFGVSGAALRHQFDGVAEVSFTFREVHRAFVDANQLGRALRGRRIAPDNPAAAIFFGDDPYDLLLIDSAIGSREFTLQIERKQKTDFSLDVPAIQDFVAKANAQVTVESAAGRDLTFSGTEALSFAFTCLRFLLDDDGRIVALPPDTGGGRAFGPAAPEPGRVRLNGRPALLEWDEVLAESGEPR
jgi:hypothetical protein